MSSILNNISALNAYRQTNSLRTSSTKTMEKLASGLKITRAGDDAAGLAISEKMRAQIRGLDMAHKNIQDGISLVQTAEGGMGSVHGNLHRMRELVVQGANGTLAPDDRESIQKELNQCKDEIQRIATTTEFNSMKLLDGSLSTSSTPVPVSPSGPTSGPNLPKNFGGTDSDFGSIKPTSDGGYIVAGSTLSNDGDVTGNQGNFDAWLLKLDSKMNIQWSKTYGGSQWEVDSLSRCIDVQQTSDGGYIFTSATTSNDGDVTGNHGNYDTWVVKTDSSGNIQWQKCLGGLFDEERPRIQQTSDGGYIVSSMASFDDGDVSGSHGGKDIWLVKLSNTGDIDWQKCFGGSAWDSAQNIQQTSDGGYILAGTTASSNGDVAGKHGGSDAWVVKTDSAGNIQWQRCFGGSGEEGFQDVQRTADGGYIFTGFTQSSDGDASGNHGLEDAWVVKTDSDGNIQWQKSLGGSGSDNATSIRQTSDGGYVLTGITKSSDGDVSINKGGWDFWVVKLNSTGNLQWENTLGGSADEYDGSIIENNEGFIIATSTNSTDGDVSGNRGSYDILIAELDSGGNLLHGQVQSNRNSSSPDEAPATPAYLTFQVGANTGQSFHVSIDSMTTEALGLTDGWPRVDPPDDAQTSIGMLDQAIQKVSAGRASLGAIQNALEHLMSNVSNSSLNLSAAESRIRDADMAKEMMTLSNQKILIEAGTAMLAQANQQPQNVLTLLK